MKPVDAYAEVGLLLEQTVKRVYRDEPMTADEWDTWADQILRLAAEQKKQAGYDPLREFIAASKRVAEAMQRIGGAK